MRSPAIKGVPRHRKPVVKDVFKFGAQESLADSKGELDRSSNAMAVCRAKEESTVATTVRDLLKD